MRDNSQGSNHGGLVTHSQSTNSKPMVNKFINPQKMPVTTNYVHRISGGVPIDATSRVNELLLESQKMIYAPPSREKTKQTVRSPLIDKAKAGVTLPADEYAVTTGNNQMHYQQQIASRKSKVIRNND